MGMQMGMENISLYGIAYYEKSIFKGSFRGMNFWIQRTGEKDSPVLTATAWKGPFSFEATEEEKISMDFPFSDEGLAQADAWLAGQQEAIASKMP